MLNNKNIRSIECAYDRLAPRYDMLNSLFLYKLRLNFLTSVIKKDQNTAFAELGSGTGLFFVELLDKFRAGYGLDISLQTLKVAERKITAARAKKYLLVQGDCHDIPLKDGSVDVVFMIESLQYIQNYEKLFSEIDRILARDGRLIIVHWNGLYSFIMRLKRMLKAGNADVNFVRYFTPFRLGRILAHNGFKTNKVLGVSFLIFDPVIFRNYFLKLNYILGRTLFRHFSFIFYVEAQKTQPVN